MYAPYKPFKLNLILTGNTIPLQIQVQLEPTTTWTLLHKEMYGPSKYRGILQTTKEIFREEGLLVFFFSYLFILCHQLLVFKLCSDEKCKEFYRDASKILSF